MRSILPGVDAVMASPMDSVAGRVFSSSTVFRISSIVDLGDPLGHSRLHQEGVETVVPVYE